MAPKTHTQVSDGTGNAAGKSLPAKGGKPDPTAAHSKATSGRGASATSKDAPRGSKVKTSPPTDTATGSNAAKKSNQKASKKPKQTADPRVKLKVVVRRLPPNLPEKVFWNSVEPWTGKQTFHERPPSPLETKATHVRMKTTQLIREPVEEGAQANAEQDVDMADGDNRPGDGDTKETSHAQSLQIKAGPLVDLGHPGQEKLAWRRYLPGKFKASGPSFASTSTVITTSTASRDPSVLHTFSRAYLCFKNLADLVDFHRHFDGHIFRDAAGNQSVALVEWAPYQKSPHVGSGSQYSGKKRDRKENTIQEEPDYINFIKALDGQGTELEDSGRVEKSRERTDAELLAHLTSSHASRDALQEASRNTPLLEYLRDQKKAEAASRLATSSRGKAHTLKVSSGKATVIKGKTAKGGASPAPARTAAAAAAAATVSSSSPAPTSVHRDGAGKGKGKSKAGPPSTAGSLVSDAPLSSLDGIPTGPKKKRDKADKGKAPPPAPTHPSAPATVTANVSKVKDATTTSSSTVLTPAPATPTGPKSDRKSNDKATSKKGRTGGGGGASGDGKPAKTTKSASISGPIPDSQPVILKRAQLQEQAHTSSTSNADQSHAQRQQQQQQQQSPHNHQQQQQSIPPTGPKKNNAKGERGGGGGSSTRGGGGGRGGKGGRGPVQSASSAS